MLAVVSFVAFTLWAGICVRERPVPAPQMLSALPIPLPREHTSALRIIAGPEIIADADRRTVRWETSLPADSLVTYGRSDPFEQILAKDATLTEKHSFDLPEQPFIEFCRFRVMSMDPEGNVAMGGWGPGSGPQGAVLANVTGAHPELCSRGGAPLIAWADYDEDGDLDAAVATQEGQGGRVRILRREDKGFKDVTAAACPGIEGSSVCWGDFNADGRPDLLTAGEKLKLYRSSGPPGWTLEPMANAGAAMAEAMFADLNSDGFPDVLAVDASGTPTVLLNSGPPSFQLAASKAPVPVKDPLFSLRLVHVADLTGDGLADIWYSGAGGVFLKNGNGVLTLVKNAVPYLGAAAGEAPAAALADFDTDGDLDLYVPPHGKGAGGTMLLNDGLGRFKKSAAAGELSAFREACVCAAAGDLTGNGRPDLVVGLASGGLRVFLNLGSATFMDGTEVCALPRPGTAPALSIALADTNGDSAPDLCASLASGALLLENRSLSAARGDFITIRPAGKKGALGALVCLQNAEGSQVIQACQTASSPSSAPECILGVRELGEANVEVRFTDGQVRSLRWSKTGSPRVLVIEHGE